MPAEDTRPWIRTRDTPKHSRQHKRLMHIVLIISRVHASAKGMGQVDVAQNGTSSWEGLNLTGSSYHVCLMFARKGNKSFPDMEGNTSYPDKHAVGTKASRSLAHKIHGNLQDA